MNIIFESFESVKHKLMVKNSKHYRQHYGRHYIDYNKQYKTYHYNEVKYLPDNFKFVYEINNNFSLYKEFFDGENTHIFQVEEIKCVKLFNHQKITIDGKVMNYELSLKITNKIIDKNQEIVISSLPNYIHNKLFDKFTCNNKNIFSETEKIFEKMCNDCKPVEVTYKNIIDIILSDKNKN